MKSTLKLTLLCITAFLWAAPAAFADCTAYRNAVDDALALGDHAALKKAYDKVDLCPSATYREAVGRHIAAQLYNKAIAGGASPTVAQLTEVLLYNAPWQALASLGEIERSEKHYAAASSHLQQALVAIDDPVQTPRPPASKQVLQIRQWAEESTLLASTYVPVPHRGNKFEGLGAPSIRGIVIRRVATPIHFVFGQTRFTPDGEKAAADLADILAHQQPAHIELIGHTDRKGTDEVNLALSRARAKTVADFLKSHGVDVSIATNGVGSKDPYPYSDPNGYTQDEKDTMDRRVEMRRN